VQWSEEGVTSNALSESGPNHDEETHPQDDSFARI
jgi:hypothetical protein